MANEAERIRELEAALTSCRWSLSWWAFNPAYSEKRARMLKAELAKYDAILENKCAA